MANIDRSYILSLLTQIKTGEDGRLAFYRTQPYPAMRIIAEDRVLSLQLLIEAVESGLLELLLVDAAAADQATRDACAICGRDFTEEQPAEDDQRQVVASTLYAHAACVESEAGR